jgi:hypothetical protein
MKLRTLTLAISLFFTICTHSQTVLPDTLKNKPQISDIDSLLTTTEELTLDSLKSADESLYKNSWNCTQIKYPLNTLPPKDALITIRLTEPYDHPFVQPVIGQILSKFGRRGRRIHTGTDIRLNSGDTVRCAFDGKVRLAKRFSGYGNLVLVRHNNGLETIYGHLKAIKVKVNDTIKAGDLIGLGGRTGRATCNHLHFETRLFGVPFDSNKYIDFLTCSLRSNHVYYKNNQFEIDQENFNRKPALENLPTLVAKVSTKVSTKGASKVSSKSGASKHVIRQGENLWVIAKKYNTSVKKLCTCNNITTQKTLKVGSVLRLN